MTPKAEERTVEAPNFEGPVVVTVVVEVVGLSDGNENLVAVELPSEVVEAGAKEKVGAADELGRDVVKDVELFLRHNTKLKPLEKNGAALVATVVEDVPNWKPQIVMH
ncbi:hypothetical protein NPIL_557751 [Nephila pilipes]|uniref:Uncharacterized protein n=1 Tax=Nephila pilipes TaxID=299642 RepID=A0A8X6TUT7_NEPPI|nr:hypothetical protein NPIL_557751 [Nephila pilipes]